VQVGVEPIGDVLRAEPLQRPPLEDLSDHRTADRVRHEPGLHLAVVALGLDGMRMAFCDIAVRRLADASGRDRGLNCSSMSQPVHMSRATRTSRPGTSAGTPAVMRRNAASCARPGRVRAGGWGEPGQFGQRVPERVRHDGAQQLDAALLRQTGGDQGA
jgi:hypothetical protein